MKEIGLTTEEGQQYASAYEARCATKDFNMDGRFDRIS